MSEQTFWLYVANTGETSDPNAGTEHPTIEAAQSAFDPQQFKHGLIYSRKPELGDYIETNLVRVWYRKEQRWVDEVEATMLGGVPL